MRKMAGWRGWLEQHQRRYLAIDGGSGAHLLAALARYDPRLQRVASPRHADLLLIIEPLSRKLAPAVAEIARAMPRPAHALVIGAPGPDNVTQTDVMSSEELLPSARRVAAPSVERIRAAALDPTGWAERAVADAPALEPTTIPLPSKREREIATELAVLSLGPLQPFTAGPVRLLLVCDGEQVRSARVEAGYAQRGIAQAMLQTGWQQAAELAGQFDPLAPIASQLAYVQALEQLQDWQPSAAVAQLREAALAIERAQNHLWWLVCFTDLLAVGALTDQAHAIATGLAALVATLWRRPPSAWIAPQCSEIPFDAASVAALEQLAATVKALHQRIEHHRLLALRTREIGVLAAERLVAVGVNGPVLRASQHGAGDVQSRLLMRLQTAGTDLRAATKALSSITQQGEKHSARREAPAGEVHTVVDGPRGRIGLHLVSEGGDRPADVQWQGPSRALLALVPEVLPGHKLADAEILVASLDLAMAEADG